jgi:integrase/recombinase XerD
MAEYNPKNERIKKDYYRRCVRVTGSSEKTLDAIRKALSRYETYTRFKDFKTFNRKQAASFVDHLIETPAQRTGQPIAKATMVSTLKMLRDFFGWLSEQAGYKSHIHATDIEYLNLIRKDMAIAKAEHFHDFPTLEQIGAVIAHMPTATVIERRNRALIAFTILTGMRDNAIASILLKHIDTHRTPPFVRQEPDEVRTKFSKLINTYFFPLNPEWTALVLDWIKELREQHGFTGNDPVFPRTRTGVNDELSFTAQGIEPKCWTSASRIRQIFEQAFESAGVPYFSPHTFRHTLGHLAQTCCGNAQELKAWSQNLGHENISTTLTSYGKIDPHSQGEILAGLGLKASNGDELDELEKMLRDIRKRRKRAGEPETV